MTIPSESAECSQIEHKKTRVMVYIDGFNVYYGLKNASRDADHQHLKYGGNPSDCLGRSLYWLDLPAVVQSQLKRSERCVGVKYFSAPRGVPQRVQVANPQRYIDSNRRQSLYLDALESRPMTEVILGWYSENNPHRCEVCDLEWPNFEEKVTDVNIATHMLRDAYTDQFEAAMVFSADADLVPPVSAVTEMGKRVIVGLFPGRKKAKHLRQCASEVRGIKIASLRPHRLPDTIKREGLPDLKCPNRWMPPHGWVWRSPAPVWFGQD